MSTFKERLLEEENQLLEKMEKLDAFRRSEKFGELDVIDQELLHIQFSAMSTYINCLAARNKRLQ